MDRLTLDATPTRTGAMVYSLPDEKTAMPGAAFTERAWSAFSGWVARLIADRCAMRAQLQVANGGRPDPDPVCLP